MWCPPLEACQLLTQCHQPAGKNEDEKDKGLRMGPTAHLPEVCARQRQLLGINIKEDLY